MQVRQHHDVAAFAELTAPLWHADPVRNTVAITVLAAQLRGDMQTPVVTMLTVHDGGVLAGAALRVQNWSLIATALPPRAASAVAEVLATAGPAPSGVIGPSANARAFADAWCRRTGAATRVEMAQRLFELGELRPPGGVPGAPRPAGMADVELLARWRDDFSAAALPDSWPRPADPQAVTRRQLAAGQGSMLWEVGGVAVSLAVASVPSAGMSRIGPVWTPPEHRRRGYGSAATAAASKWARDHGAEHVVLFTDLANPVSNSIYPKIGYRPLHDNVDLAFVRS